MALRSISAILFCDCQLPANTQPMPKRSTISIDERVGVQLRTLRQSRDITQQQLAKHLDISFQQVQKYEKGQNRIAVATLIEICTFFKVPVTFFFDGLPEPMVANPVEEDPVFAEIRKFLASQEGIEFLRCYLAIRKTKARKSVSELVKLLAQIA